MNAPATFQAVMEKVLEPVLWKTCIIYIIDDLIIFLQAEEEHLEHLAEVLRLLDEAGLRMKIKKCHFEVRPMQLLGFDFREDGMRPQEDRALKIQQVVVERTRTGILSFLGIVRDYQRFVPHLADLSQPLTCLLRKEKCVGMGRGAVRRRTDHQGCVSVSGCAGALQSGSPYSAANGCITVRSGSDIVSDTDGWVGAPGLFQ